MFRRQRNVQQWREQGDILPRIKLDVRQRTLQLPEATFGGYVDPAETLAAPFGNRVQWRVLQELGTVPFSPGMRHFTQAVMKFLYQARFAQPRLADNHHQLPVASPCSLPTAHQHGDFLVTPHKRREVALARAASTAACPDEPEQCH